MKNLYTLFLFCASLLAVAQTGISVPQMTSCDAQVQNFLNTHGINGATFALAKDGKMIYMRGFGYSDLAQTDSVQPHHVFRLASVSKPITGIGIMKLIEDGLLSLSDTVFGPNGVLASNAYISSANITDSRIYDITVQHLLEHTGGWNVDQSCVPGNPTPYPYHFSFCDPKDFPLHVTHTLGEPNPANREMLIRWLLEKGLQHNPGSGYYYSNTGYLVLGEIIEEVSGMDYEDYLKTAIFDPIGICDIRRGYSLPADKGEREVEYTGNGGQNLSAYGTGQMVPWEYGGFILEEFAPAGGWTATARDLVRLILAVDGFSSKPDILNTSTINTMTTPSSVSNYAKGWAVNSLDNWWHTGSLDGTASLIVRSSGGYAWALILNERNANSTSFWSDLDALPWNCISGLGSVAGIDLLAVPQVSPANLSYSVNSSNGNVDLTWTNGDGDQRLVVVSREKAKPAYPVDGANYVDNATYGQGNDLGHENYVVYNGNQSSVTVSGLNPDSTYNIRIYEYNRNSTTGQHALYNHCERAEDQLSLPAVSLRENHLSFHISPNPVEDILSVELSENITAEVFILNSAGIVVQKQRLNGAHTFAMPIHKLPSGIYFLQISDPHFSGTKRFVKM